RKGEEVELEGELDVAGEDVLVFDDIVETGSTMVEAYRELEEQEADRIEAAAVHGVLEEGVERAANVFDRFYLTNTVERDYANISVEPLLKSHLNL
ncbi:MAG: phosphoribosyltransferase family protein, partial [Candidatus Nanohaloarchaea archaeon]|nr:phosphoribosyltransferase family protein [Candidatus Nanohaloarchaea archaeon]